MADIVTELIEILGDAAVIKMEQVAERASSFWDARPMQAKALLRPKSTQEVSAVMKLCHAAGQTVITHGGLSGCAKGAATTTNHIVVSLECMNIVEEIDTLGNTATIQAGVILQTAQEKIAEKDLYLALDLGARGSCTVGGNVATNAGGINVIRYGMARNHVLGLEVVMADGTVISSMNHMLKNNSGYDLKQLFIGTEGTLGIITRIIVKLEAAPISRNAALVAMKDFSQVIKFLTYLKKHIGSILSAYEVMWGDYYRAVTQDGWNKSPMERSYEFYVIAECEGSDSVADTAQFMKVLELAFEDDLILDAIIPKSESERTTIWNIRENFEAILENKPYFLYDVSLPIKHMDEYIVTVKAGCQKRWPNGNYFVLGHIGDGNLHIFVIPHAGDDGDLHHLSDKEIYTPLKKFGGAVSAEHGIGTEKKAWLTMCRSDAEITLMKTLKESLDPKGILNPGVIFD